MIESLDLSLAELDSQTALIARQFAARALRQQEFYFIHQLKAPTNRFVPSDELFQSVPTPPELAGPISNRRTHMAPTPVEHTISVCQAAEMYLNRKRISGLGQSQIDENARLLGWLQEVLGAEFPLQSVTREEMRGFRDDVRRVDGTLRGRKGAFKDRLTNVSENQVKSATYLRYWNAAQAFFRWCVSEGYRAHPSYDRVFDFCDRLCSSLSGLANENELRNFAEAKASHFHKSNSAWRPLVPPTEEEFSSFEWLAQAIVDDEMMRRGYYDQRPLNYDPNEPTIYPSTL